jgi:hypothetical protein
MSFKNLNSNYSFLIKNDSVLEQQINVHAIPYVFAEEIEGGKKLL